ncbi:hypothetical protein ACTMU2_20290 [Cupriavidus basilensis]
MRAQPFGDQRVEFGAVFGKLVDEADGHRGLAADALAGEPELTRGHGTQALHHERRRICARR